MEAVEIRTQKPEMKKGNGYKFQPYIVYGRRLGKSYHYPVSAMVKLCVSMLFSKIPNTLRNNNNLSKTSHVAGVQPKLSTSTPPDS